MGSDCGADNAGGPAVLRPAESGRARRVAGTADVVRAVARLAKVRISALAGLSAATGHILAVSGVTAQAAGVASGVFLIACGSCALNQIQDRTIDSLMLRTRHRPIPAGLIGVPLALALSLVLTAAGSIALYSIAGSVPLGLALLAAAWYNGVYTYLKRYTEFAAIPGGVVGAIPPAVGWVAGGGGLLHPQILALMVFMFVWQVPHFWLLLLSNGDDYDRAGLPSLTRVFPPRQLGRITFIWILAAAVSCMLVPLLGAARPELVIALLAGAAVWLLPSAARQLGGSAWRDESLARDRRTGAPVSVAASECAPPPASAPGDLNGGVVGAVASARGSAALGVAAVYIKLNVYALLVLCALSAGGILNGMY
jgi:protoheme IX farnesyltransferase